MNILETVGIAMNSLRANKLRASLTILGIIVGIFSIVVIMTVITMLQNSIEDGVSSLGQNTFQIQKWPAMRTGGHSEWAKYRNRKDITLEDFERLQDELSIAKYMGAELWQWGRVIKFKGEETNPNVQLAGITAQAQQTNEWIVQVGRPIRELDVDRATNVCVLGFDVKTKLFPNADPVGMTVKIDNRPFRVIGVYERRGEMFGQSRDNFVVVPIRTWQSMYGKYDRSVNITVSSFGKRDYNAVIEAAIGHMRTIRKVKPWEENDFDIFSNESLLEQINDITKYVEYGAIAVSIIALIAAGVGIMNIMLVSVTERTREIGIRKAIGAKKISILLQFLTEAITLCIFGGLVGIFLGVLLGNVAGSFLSAATAIPYDWVVIGLALCVFVGVVFGTYPAIKASNLDPIEALRYE